MARLDELKASCRIQLWPFFEMFKHKKNILNEPSWLDLLKKTEESIIKSPQEYLKNSAKKNILEAAIKQVFEEFLIEMASNP